MSASKHGVTVELDKNVTERTREEFPAQSGSSRVQGRCIFRCTRKRFYSVAVSAGVCPGQVRSGLRFDDACSDERTGVAGVTHDNRDGSSERERQSTIGHGGSAPHCCSIAHVPCQRELEKAFACCSASDSPLAPVAGEQAFLRHVANLVATYIEVVRCVRPVFMARHDNRHRSVALNKKGRSDRRSVLRSFSSGCSCVQ